MPATPIISIDAGGLAIGIIMMIFSFYISYNIIMGIKDIEIIKEQTLNSDQLYFAWKLLVVFSVLTYVLLIFPILAIACVVISFAIGICYLVIFNKTRKLFNEMDFAEKSE